MAPVALPFEFSLGVPLSTVPVAHAALTLLRWLKDSLTAEEISWLLLSGFVAPTDTEALELARVDSRIRNSGLMPMQMSLSGFMAQFRKYKRDSGSRLADRLAAMQKLSPGEADALATGMDRAGPGSAPISRLAWTRRIG